MSKKSAAELFRAAFFGDGDESETKAKEREAELARQRRERETADRVCAAANGKFSYGAARRALREADEAYKKTLEPSDEVSDDELEAMRVMGMTEENPGFEAHLAKYLTNREARKTAERRRRGLDPHARPSEYRPPANPLRYDFKEPQPAEHPLAYSKRPTVASRTDEHVVTLDDADAMPLVPDPASPTKGLSPEALRVARLCGEDPLRLARYIAAKGAVRFAAAAVDE